MPIQGTCLNARHSNDAATLYEAIIPRCAASRMSRFLIVARQFRFMETGKSASAQRSGIRTGRMHFGTEVAAPPAHLAKFRLEFGKRLSGFGASAVPNHPASRRASASARSCVVKIVSDQ